MKPVKNKIPLYDGGPKELDITSVITTSRNILDMYRSRSTAPYIRWGDDELQPIIDYRWERGRTRDESR